MQILKTNIFKLMLLSLLFILSLIFNHNVDFWIGKEKDDMILVLKQMNERKTNP